MTNKTGLGSRFPSNEVNKNGIKAIFGQNSNNDLFTESNNVMLFKKNV